jgi:hypothetical protein
MQVGPYFSFIKWIIYKMSSMNFFEVIGFNILNEYF